MMTKNKMTPYQGGINDYISQKELFIDNIRKALKEQTPSLDERQHRLEIFDSLLLKATYSELSELEQALRHNLPSAKDDSTINYLGEQLREINGFCTQAFSHDHKVYNTMCNSLTCPTPDVKKAIREQLSRALIAMIFTKTKTEVPKTNPMI